MCIRDMVYSSPFNRNNNDNLTLLLSKANKKFVINRKQGTLVNWPKSGPLDYGLEKLTLNFIVYRHNMEKHNAQIFEPGHMETQAQYNNIAKKFSEVYMNWSFDKNMIYDLSADRYVAY